MNRFDYVKYDERIAGKQAVLKRHFSDVAAIVEEYISDSISRSLVLTKLEEAYMWTGKALRDEQIMCDSDVKLQEERTNS